MQLCEQRLSSEALNWQSNYERTHIILQIQGFFKSLIEATQFLRFTEQENGIKTSLMSPLLSLHESCVKFLFVAFIKSKGINVSCQFLTVESSDTDVRHSVLSFPINLTACKVDTKFSNV